MRKFIIIIITFFFFSACSKSGENELKLEILNNEFYSIKKFDTLTTRNVISFDNYIYDSLFVNKINIKISNSGSEKMVFFLSNQLSNSQESSRDNIKVAIYQNEKYLNPSLILTYAGTSQDPVFKEFLNGNYLDSLKYKRTAHLEKIKPNFKQINFQREMQYIVIHPRESKFFSYYQTLPIFQNNSSFWMYKLSDEKKSSLQLSIISDAKIVSKNITSNQLEEINQNGYKIFDGVIKSNKVPIKFKTLK